jgi:hypothetical protein
MKNRVLKNLTVAAVGAASLFSLAALTLPGNAQAQVSVVIRTPPPPLRAEVVPAPRAGYVWAPGHYEWRGGRHAWVRGVYLRARPGYAYRAPEWYQRDGRWEYRAGRWDRDGDGVPNRADRDRDNDGVRNRNDRRPNNPNRN